MSFRKDASGKDLEVKSFTFEVKECKQLKTDKTIGVIKGYASTFGNIDRGNDTVAKGAFDRTLLEHRQRGQRPIRLYANHRSEAIIGGLPIEKVKVDNVGLFVEAHLDLNVAKAAEFFSLAQKGFLSDFSIGFSTRKREFDEETGIRTLIDIELFEVSLVNEPMDQQAVVTEVETDSGDGKSKRASNSKRQTKRGKTMATQSNEGAANNDGLVIFTSPEGKKIGIDEDGELVEVPQDLKKFEVKDVESLKTNAEVEELLKTAGFSKEARKALIRVIRDGFGSDDREDQKDEDGREDQSTNGREAENVKRVADSISDLGKLLIPTKTEEET